MFITSTKFHQSPSDLKPHPSVDGSFNQAGLKSTCGANISIPWLTAFFHNTEVKSNSNTFSNGDLTQLKKKKCIPIIGLLLEGKKSKINTFRNLYAFGEKSWLFIFQCVAVKKSIWITVFGPPSPHTDFQTSRSWPWTWTWNERRQRSSHQTHEELFSYIGFYSLFVHNPGRIIAQMRLLNSCPLCFFVLTIIFRHVTVT